MSPVRYQPSGVKAGGRGRRVVPVALEQGGAAELDLAVVGEPHLDPRRWAADRADAVIVEGRAAAGPGLGRAVALEDRDAEVLPALLERRRQEGAGRQEEPEVAAQLGVDAAEEEPPPQARGQVAGERTQAIEGRPSWPRLATSRSIALQNRSRIWGTTTIEVTRWSRSASKMTRGLRLRT